MSEVKRYWHLGVMYDFPDPDPMYASGQIEYVLATDYDREHQRRVEAEALLPDPIACMWGTPCAEAMPKHPHRWCESCKVRAHLAKWGKE